MFPVTVKKPLFTTAYFVHTFRSKFLIRQGKVYCGLFFDSLRISNRLLLHGNESPHLVPVSHDLTLSVLEVLPSMRRKDEKDLPHLWTCNHDMFEEKNNKERAPNRFWRSKLAHHPRRKRKGHPGVNTVSKLVLP
jgi:hypothetical protein